MAPEQAQIGSLPEANQFANYLISLTRREGRQMSAYKLKKLLYYIQAWSLSRRGRPAFKDEVRAWKDGPVVKAVFTRFREGYYVEDVVPKPDKLSTEDKEHAYGVWMLYREF